MSKRALGRHDKAGDLKNVALSRFDYWTIAGVALAAAIPRLLLLFALPPLLHLDSDSYFEIAQRLWRGNGFGNLSRRTPLYPMFLSIAGKWESLGFFPVVVLQHFIGICCTVLLFLIARRLFGPDHRLASAVVSMLSALAFFPVIVEHTILAESLFTFLLLSSALAVLAWQSKGTSRHAAIAGVLLSFAALTKPVAIGIFPLWVGLLFLLGDRQKAMLFGKWAGASLLLLLLPLLVRNTFVMGRLALTESLGRNLISVADRFVDFEHGRFLKVKAVYKEFMVDKRGPDAVIAYAAMPRLRAVTGMNDVAIDRALASVGWEAIRQHPFAFVYSRLCRLPVFWRDPNDNVWQLLHLETYFPLVSFIGKQNPEMVARSLSIQQLQTARFDLARWCFKVFGYSMFSGWWVLLPLLGILSTVWCGNRIGAVLLASMILYLWASTIFLQPPNARYRIPTFSLEILFAIAGILYLSETFAKRIGKNLPIYWNLKLKPLFPLFVVIIGFASLCTRTVAASHEHPLFTLQDWQRKQTMNSPLQIALDTSHLVQEISFAGRKRPVVYWAGSSRGELGRISARISVTGGERYRISTAYSCSVRACADGLLRITYFDSKLLPLPKSTEISLPLSQDRDDNDLFWDQLVKSFNTPTKAVSAELELTLRGGGGSLVIPFLTIEKAFD